MHEEGHVRRCLSGRLNFEGRTSHCWYCGFLLSALRGPLRYLPMQFWHRGATRLGAMTLDHVALRYHGRIMPMFLHCLPCEPSALLCTSIYPSQPRKWPYYCSFLLLIENQQWIGECDHDRDGFSSASQSIDVSESERSSICAMLKNRIQSIKFIWYFGVIFFKKIVNSLHAPLLKMKSVTRSWITIIHKDNSSLLPESFQTFLGNLESIPSYTGDLATCIA